VLTTAPKLYLLGFVVDLLYYTMLIHNKSKVCSKSGTSCTTSSWKYKVCNRSTASWYAKTFLNLFACQHLVLNRNRSEEDKSLINENLRCFLRGRSAWSWQ